MMDEFDKVSSRLNEMKSRFDNGFSTLDREYISALYKRVFGKVIQNKHCGSCYKDAYVELIYQFKKMGKLTKEENRNYSLKAGEFISYFGSGEYLINPITDEQAEKFLSKFPKRIVIFDSYPEDWKERCEKRAATLDQEEKDQEEKDQEENNQEENNQEENTSIPISEDINWANEEIPVIDENGNISSQEEERKPSKRQKTKEI